MNSFDSIGQKFSDSETSRAALLSSSADNMKEVKENPKFKQRKSRFYLIIGFLVLAILLASTFTFIFTFVIKKNPSQNTTNMTTSKNTATSISMATSTTMTTPDTESLPQDKTEQQKSLTTCRCSFLLGCPIVFSRSSWNARPYRSRRNLTTSPVRHIVVLEPKPSNLITNQQDCIREIKGFQDYHMGEPRNWDDIAYNFMLCNDNDDQQQIYIGRGWTYAGAHCKGYNERSL
ncbi:unnamed protein product, partial [Rotaria sp. Silwood2]